MGAPYIYIYDINRLRVNRTSSKDANMTVNVSSDEQHIF